MHYSNVNQYANYGYPDMDLPPDEKDLQWGMDYAKAAFFDWSYTFPCTCFYNNGGKYEQYRLYALGKNPVNQYKKWMGVDAQTDATWINIDWSVRPIVSKFRAEALSQLEKQEYGIVATPIDPTSKADLDKYYAEAKAKIAVRQMMQQQNPELAAHPLLQAQPGEALDMEEMQMRIDFGEQFNRSKDAEEAIQLGLYENGSKQLRKSWFEDLFDFGLAAYKEWLGDDNKPKCRRVNPENVITNYCRWGDFRDLIHFGEVVDVSLVELATLEGPDGGRLFTEKDLNELASDIAGKWGNPTMLGKGTGYFKPYDKFKVKVFDLEFFSYNDYNYRSSVDSRGNLKFGRAPWKRGLGSAADKYTRRTIKVVYKVKWIVGTDRGYDFGLATDMKRSKDPATLAETSLSYKAYAYNFYEMRAQGMMERLIPIIDDYQLTIYKIQNFKNRAVPSGWWIDLDALEGVALNKGGKNMTPRELLDMFMQTGVLVGRSKDVIGNNVNYKPVIPIENTAASELAMFYQDLQMQISQMQQIVGFNPITSGAGAERNPVSGVETAVASTDNALYPLQFAERWLFEKLANDVLVRMQQGIKKGGIGGYAPALNTNTLKFMQVSEDLPLHEYGIILEEKPTDDQRAAIMQQLQIDIQQGFLDTSDAFFVLNTQNAKQAQMILAYKVKRNKMAAEMSKQNSVSQTIQGQQQSAQITSQLKQQEIQLEYQLKSQLVDKEKQYDLQIKSLELQVKDLNNQRDNQTKTFNNAVSTQQKSEVPGPQ